MRSNTQESEYPVKEDAERIAAIYGGRVVKVQIVEVIDDAK